MKLDSKKLKLIRSLEEQKVLIEECPEPNESEGVAFWRFKVLIPAKLPIELIDEFKELNEIRV
jgi:hypothetical protein